ncbi:MAG: hypothetical protein ACREEQ_11880, partial [Caulobacteraceae bacterium]
MTVAATTTETTYALAGSNVGPFSTVWPYAADADVTVYVNLGAGAGAAPTQLFDLVDAGGLPASGNVTLNASLVPAGGWGAGASVTLKRATPLSQPSAFGELASFDPANIEAALDQVDRQVQDLGSSVQRAVLAPFGEVGVTLPPLAEREGDVAAYDANGNPSVISIAALVAEAKGDPGGNVMAVGLATAIPGLNIPVGTDLIQTSGYNQTGVGAARYAASTNAAGATPWRFQTANGRWFELCEQFPDPKMFGAVADGASHPIAAPDIAAHPEWIGTYAAGTEWDTVGVQECVYACFADGSIQGNLLWNALDRYGTQNKAYHLAFGQYRISQQILLLATFFLVFGDGKQASVLNWYGPNNESMVLCDSASYGCFRDFALQAEAATSQALMDLDHTGTYATLETQQLTLKDLAWFGNGLAEVGVRISKSGSAAQGDTINFENNFWGSFLFAGVSIGAPGVPAENALAICFRGGDIQSCTKYGLYNLGGQFYIDGTNFEGQIVSANNSQIHNGGADIFNGGAYVAGVGLSTARNVRSESDVFLAAVGGNRCGVYIEDASLSAASAIGWAPNAATTQGQLVRGTPGVGAKGQSGRTFLAVVAGQTAAAEPTWDASLAHGVVGYFTAIAAGAATVTGAMPTTPQGAGAAVGWGVMIPGAGANGGPLITTISAIAGDYSTFTLAEAATAAVAAGVPFYFGPLLV